MEAAMAARHQREHLPPVAGRARMRPKNQARKELTFQLHLSCLLSTHRYCNVHFWQSSQPDQLFGTRSLRSSISLGSSITITSLAKARPGRFYAFFAPEKHALFACERILRERWRETSWMSLGGRSNRFIRKLNERHRLRLRTIDARGSKKNVLRLLFLQ